MNYYYSISRTNLFQVQTFSETNFNQDADTLYGIQILIEKRRESLQQIVNYIKKWFFYKEEDLPEVIIDPINQKDEM